VDAGEDLEGARALAVEVGEPGLGGPPVVEAGEQPALLERELPREGGQQVGRGHHTAGEEVARHPVGGSGVLERVGELAVAEDVDEELAARREPAREAGEERRVVPHVLEHLDRDDAIEAAVELEAVDVGHPVLDVAEPAPRGLGAQELPLRRRVRHREHGRARVALGDPERERAPAAAEIEHPLAVLETGARGGQREHLLLGGREILDPGREEAGAVLQARPEHQPEELGGHLVVLPVGGVGRERERPLGRRPPPGFEPGRAAARQAPAFGAQAGGEQPPDAEADQRVGHQAPVDQRHGGRDAHAAPPKRTGPRYSGPAKRIWASESARSRKPASQ